MLSWLYWQDTSHHKVAILFFHGGDLVSLSLLRGPFCIKLCLVLVRKNDHRYFKVLCIYILRMLKVNRNEKLKGNGVLAKVLFLISVYFPYNYNTIHLIIIIIQGKGTSCSWSGYTLYTLHRIDGPSDLIPHNIIPPSPYIRCILLDH